MKVHILILTLLSLALFASCEYIIELPLSNSGNKIYAECFTNESDTTFIKLNIAIPSNKDPFIASIENASIKYSVDGHNQDIQRYKRGNENLYYSVEEIGPEKVVTLDITVPGCEDVQARDIIPDITDFFVNNQLIDRQGKMVLKYNLKFHKEDNDTGTFAVHFSRKRIEEYKTLNDDGTYSIHSVESRPELPLDASVKSIDGNEVFYSRMNKKDIFVLSDKCEGEIYVEIEFPYLRDSKYQYGQATDFMEIRYQYQISLYHLSQDAWLFLKARHEAATNIGVLYNLTAPSFAFTNLTNGYGVLGGCSRKDSGWLDNYDLETGG